MNAPKLFSFKGQMNSRPFELRVSRHPSEGTEYFLARVLAYLIHLDSSPKFCAELCEDGDPHISVEKEGVLVKWIDIGLPSLKRVKEAKRRSDHYEVFCYKDPEGIKKRRAEIAGINGVRFYLFKPPVLKELGTILSPKNSWDVEWDGEWIHINGIEGKILEY
jgi:uncharacterized protein YaeQ